MAAISVYLFEAMEIILRIRRVGCNITMISNSSSLLFSITVGLGRLLEEMKISKLCNEEEEMKSERVELEERKQVKNRALWSRC